MSTKTYEKIKEAYRRFWLVKGHLNASLDSALGAYDDYGRRLWRAGSDGAPLYEYEKGFEEAWSKKWKEIRDKNVTD